MGFTQTSMYVPEPVISLSLKVNGKETPNFSRALNRFQKEDPTFKVHLDHDSKEVWNQTIRVSQRFGSNSDPHRRSSPEWVNCISKFT